MKRVNIQSIRSMFCGIALLAAAAHAGAQTAAAPPALSLASDAQTLAREALGSLPGSSVVGLWREGKAFHAGWRDGAPIAAAELTGDKAPIFEIGSITKVFTGLLLAQAVDKGELSLDDTIGQLLAGKVKFGSAKVASVTLRQLVTHTSCMPRLPGDFWNGARPEDPYRGYDRTRIWAALSDMSFDASPPCEASYSNLGFGVLGELLSERYGKPWDALVRERITAPLGMNDTVKALGDKASRLAPAFAGDKPALPWEMQAFEGAGALRSTASDMLLFGRALLAGRKGPLGPAAERVTTTLAKFGGDIGHAILMRGPASRRTWLHEGGTGGYRSELMVAVDTGEVMIVLASNAEAPVSRVGADLLAARYPVEAGAASIEPARLAEYAGVYRVNPQVVITVVAQDGVLYSRGTGQPFAAMAPAAPDVFTVDTRARLVFERSEGKITGLNASSRGVEFRAKRVDELAPALAVLQPEQLQPFVGRYKAAGLDFDVRSSGGQLQVKLNEQPRFPVFPVAGQAHRFAYDVVKAELQFERDASGIVRALVLHQNGVHRAERSDSP